VILRPLTATVAALGLFACAPTALRADERPLPWNAAVLRQSPDWYASAKARVVAAYLMTHQSPEGGWPKNTPLNSPARADADRSLANSFDNQATTLPLAYLARMITATGEPAYSDSFYRGLDYILAAQYPNGGWPQYYPLRGGYHDHVTFNDDAMVNILNLLQSIARGHAPYGFVTDHHRTQAKQALARGTDLILQAQIRQDGRLTVWCAQHDAVTLAPAWGRRFEPPSLSGNESVGIVRFLMSIDSPSAEITAAINGAIGWFDASAIHDHHLEAFTDSAGEADLRLTPVAGAPPLWARFYDLQTNKPLFMGRDSVPHARLEDIDQERRTGYAYIGPWPRGLMRDVNHTRRKATD